MNPGSIGLCAAVGLSSVPVYERPRVGILSTGSELLSPGEPLQPGKIWSSNAISLSGLVEDAGGVAVVLDSAGDSAEELSCAISNAQKMNIDILLTTGGVSVGDHDRVKQALHSQGMDLEFWKVRMKPGKPLAFGTIGKLPVFGLPGNPVSCMVGFLQFVRPFIRKTLSDPNPFLPVLPARFDDTWTRRAGRNEFLRVRLFIDKQGLTARLSGGQGSARISGMAISSGLALIGHEESQLKPGDNIHVQLLSMDGLEQPDMNYQWYKAPEER